MLALLVSAQFVLQMSNAVDTQGSIKFGDVKTGSITAYGKAYYQVTFTATEPQVVFEACGSSFDTYLYFYDANMGLINSCDDCNNYGERYCGLQGDLAMTNVAPGTYYVAVGGYSSSSGNYKLSMIQGYTTQCGNTETGEITSYSKDFYRWDVPSSYNAASYSHVFLEACGSGFDTWLYLYDADFNLLNHCDDCNNFGYSCGTRGDLDLRSYITAGNSYYLGVGGWSSSQGSYSVSLNCVASDSYVPGEYEVVRRSGYSWQSAQAYCQNTYGTNLATIHNDDDAQYLLDASKNQLYGWGWLGLNDLDQEGNWVYKSGAFDCSAYGSNGCAANYPYWDEGEPNDYGLNEDCGHVRYESATIATMINDHTCSWTGTSGFFCDKSTAAANFARGSFDFGTASKYVYHPDGVAAPWFVYVVGLLVLLLLANLAIMCYVNCCKQRNRGQGYLKVARFNESDVEEAEAQSINV